MKTKNVLTYAYLVLASLSFLITGCKKRTEISLVNTTDDATLQAIIAGDEFEVNYELDQTLNEAIMASCISSTTSGEATSTTEDILFTLIPDAVIDTAKIKKGIITITYYGKTPDKTKARSGTLEIRHALVSGKVVPWKTKGAKMTINYDQFEVIFLNTVNKSIVLNKTCTIKNLEGGLLTTLSPGNSVVDQVSGKLTFTNNDNTTILTEWVWNFKKHRVFTLMDTTITATITGDTTIGNISNVTTWGTTRSDQPFYTSITSAVFQNVYKSPFLFIPLSGVKTIEGIKEPITITYGVGKDGNPVNNGRPYGYKYRWTDASGITKGGLTPY